MNNPLLHETKVHGTLDFPYIVYHGKIPDFIDSYPLHWHEEAELIYVMSGQFKITVWSNTYLVQEGDIIILMPHVIHSIEQIDSCFAEYFNIIFHFSFFGYMNDDACYQKYLKPFIAHEKTVNCYEKSGTKLNTLLKPFLLSLIENRRNSYTENITIKKAAALCGFSESHFMKLFKELTGTSFTAYLVNYRLELAAKQLIETNQKVIDIATNCGFNNHSYFTRSFIKKYGVTPVKYRTNSVLL